MAGKVSVGVIGVGRIGRLHARNLAHHIAGVSLRGLSDVNREALGACAEELGVSFAVENYRAVVEEAGVDAVVICSSTNAHSRIIADAAAAGKHVFCEKPIDLDLGKIDEALAAVEEAEVKLQVGFNRRFDPSFRRAREAVAGGRIGEPHLLRITSRDPQPPPLEYVRVSGGMFLDMSIHDFDMARYLVGSEVEEVFAVGGVRVDPKIGEAGDIDTAVTTLRFRNGAVGAIDNSRRAVYGYDQRAEVFGPGGMVVVSNVQPDSALVSDGEGVHGSPPLFFFLERYGESYLAEMQEFVECIREDRTPEVSGADGRIAVVMGYAARKSYEENRPVKLSEIAPV
ncbi:MAG: inositol 2-dehydrogenase [Armatimonadota bacterium]|nr:MAG: inositol 2-dehydrogenase [Armatimonadota bacterium]